MIAALALIVLLAVLWFALVKPQIKTQAQEVVAPIDQRLDAASIPELPTATNPAGDDGGSGGGGATTTTTIPGGAVTIPPVTATTVADANGAGGDPTSAYGQPYTFRLEVQSGSSPTATFTVPAGETFALTDSVFQNPQGDTGRLTVKRNGDVLLDLNLQSLRLSDEHSIAPTIFAAGDTLSVTVSCDEAGPTASQCADAVTFSGFRQ